jgi:hypothetical protein
MITQQQLLDFFDYRDGNLFWKFHNSKRGQRFIGKKAGSKMKNGYYHILFNGKYIYLHRAIFFMHYGYLPQYIDHIDGNPANNKIENLREATASQNCWNQKYKGSASGHKGITWNKQDKKWQPQLTANNKKIYLGKYDDLETAIKVYKNASEKYHKEFARF